MKSQANVWIVAGSLVLAASLDARADDLKVVTVEAEAPFTGDLAATEKEAKRQARRKAVEEGAGVLVESNSIVRNYQLLADEIVTASKGVIVDEQWGALENSTANSKKIKLTAKVSPQAISDSICTVVKANHDPKVTLVFVEKYGDEDKWSTERSLIESRFTEAFMDNCFTIVESGVKVTEVSANGDLPQSTINDIIKNSDAQFVVLGNAKVVKQKPSADSVLGDKMGSFSVSANLKLINTANNEIEAVASKQLQVIGISAEKALEAQDGKVKKNLTGAILDDLMKKISARWTNDMVNASKVNVVVQNIANIQAAKAFKTAVAAAIEGVRIEQRKVSGGTASFDITVDGGAEVLADKIDGKKAGKYAIEVVELSRGKLIIKLK